MSKAKKTPVRAVAGKPIPTGAELRKLREQHQLTQIQLAELVHINIRRNGRSLTSDAVQRWERTGEGMSEATWELLEVKLLLLRKGYTLEELLKIPLHVLIARLL